MMAGRLSSAPAPLTFSRKLLRMNWTLVILLTALSLIGFAMLYSVADGSLTPWARAQMVRFVMGLTALFIIAMIDRDLWRSTAYVFYGGSLLLLIGVEVAGVTGMGAQRWIDLGPLRLQPSELMKIALVVCLARFYHDIGPDRASHPLAILGALMLIALPAALVLKQPDLGTTMLLCLGGFAVMFLAGVNLWFFTILVGVTGLAIYGVFASEGTEWQLLKDYQYSRIKVFIDPGLDPRGAGYQITQSKIAFGSGGLFGMGYLQGPQSHLDFLPEKHTDFIFTTLGEEFGLIGGVTLLGLYMLVIVSGLITATRIRDTFGKLVASGVCMTFFGYFAVNIAMVIGLAPVVGVPLPLVSYGGTSMLVLLAGFGLLQSAQVHDAPDRRGD